MRAVDGRVIADAGIAFSLAGVKWRHLAPARGLFGEPSAVDLFRTCSGAEQAAVQPREDKATLTWPSLGLASYGARPLGKTGRPSCSGLCLATVLAKVYQRRLQKCPWRADRTQATIHIHTRHLQKKNT